MVTEMCEMAKSEMKVVDPSTVGNHNFRWGMVDEG